MSTVWLGTFLVTVVAVLIAMSGLAAGLAFGRGAPRGSCGAGACRCQPGARLCEATEEEL